MGEKEYRKRERGNCSHEYTLETMQLLENSLQALLRLSQREQAVGNNREETGREANRETQTQGETFIYRSIVEDICQPCPRYRICYGVEEEGTRRELSKIVCGAEKRGHSSAQDTSPDFRKKCVYFQPLMEEMEWLIRLTFQNRYWEHRIEELRGVMRGQLAAQYHFFKECRRQITQGKRLERHHSRRLRRRLLSQGIWMREGWESREEDGGLTLFLDLFLFGPCETGKISAILSGIYQKTMCCCEPERWIHRGKISLCFAEENEFHVCFGKAHCSMRKGDPCGDTFSFLNHDRKRAVLCLCDGMGAGEEAYRSSSRLLEALEAMLAAGIAEEYAMEMLHAVCLPRENGQFSTLDMSILSLRTGMVKMIKAGGTATFLRHSHTVERICAKSLPPGCLPGQEFDCRHKKLYDGDMIIMMSDGMLDFEKHGILPLTMENIIAGIETANAQKFAEELLEAVPEMPDGCGDDRTVLVAVIWEKGNGIHVGKSESIRTGT